MFVFFFWLLANFRKLLCKKLFQESYNFNNLSCFLVTSVVAEIYQPEVLDSAFSMVSKLNCSSRIERSDTCIDLNEP